MIPFSRRYFLMGGVSALAARGAAGRTVSLKRAGYKSPNEKLNIAAVGAGGKGSSDIAGCASENIVAFADPDWERAANTFKKFEKAARYKDFRQMLDKQKDIDAVTISTPDHMHAFAAMACMELGKHVYVQKPLTRLISETRKLTEAARRYGVATQMGNQGHCGNGVRQLCEMIWSGAIGDVREVHAWTNRPIWPQGIEAPLPAEPVRASLDWDVWLGPAEKRPYNAAYAPFKWRGWYDFGCGALGDMACHILDAPNWAMQLQGGPRSVECIRQTGKNPHTFPKSCVLKYEFPARGAMPPVTLYWYDGGEKPKPPDGIDIATLGDGKGANGSLFIGSKGMITTGTYGSPTRLVPASRMKEYKLPDAVLTRAPSTHRDWIRACKGGERACSNFDYAGPFTEWVLLGTAALRFEGKLLWDARKMKVTNRAEANRFLNRPYRKGWKL